MVFKDGQKNVNNGFSIKWNKEMAKTNLNGIAKWIVVALALLTLAFNSGVLYNDVKHLKGQLSEIKEEIKDLRSYIMELP